MPRESPYRNCTYLRRNGTICGKRCIRNLCGEHIDCNPQTPCLICGKGTQSTTGYCSAAGGCLVARHNAFQRANRITKKMFPPVGVEIAPGNNLDSILDELLA